MPSPKYIIYDQTWKRHLWYGKTHSGEKKCLWEVNEDHPITLFNTWKSAMTAIKATRTYEEGKYAWCCNIYTALPVK